MQAVINPIRIGVDIRDLRMAKTGQKTVWEELCRQFRLNTDPSIEFVFLDDENAGPSGKKKWQIIIGHLKYQYWKQIRLPWKAYRNKCRVVFCGDYFVPLLQPGFKTIEIFHDAFFFEYPQHYNASWLQLFHALAMPAARKCSYIITTSSYARNQVHQYTGIPLHQLVSVLPGPKTFPAIAKEVPQQLSSLTTQPFILHVGVFEKRKNLPALIKAFSLLCQQGNTTHRLVLVGEGNKKADSDDSTQVQAAIAASGVAERIICTGYLPDEQVAYLYQHAALYVFPSFNEGFGIPVLEAFHFKVPVLVANNTCLPEVGGNAVLAFNPYEPQSITNLMQQVLNNKTLQQNMIEKGQERLRAFSWEKAAAQLIALFKKAVHP